MYTSRRRELAQYMFFSSKESTAAPTRTNTPDNRRQETYEPTTPTSSALFIRDLEDGFLWEQEAIKNQVEELNEEMKNVSEDGLTFSIP